MLSNETNVHHYSATIQILGRLIRPKLLGQCFFQSLSLTVHPPYLLREGTDALVDFNGLPKLITQKKSA